MRKFLYKFVSNLILLLLILVIGGILTSPIVLSAVCVNMSDIVASCSCVGLTVIFVSIIITINEFLDPYHLIDKLAKLITGYNETDERKGNETN